MFKDLKMLGDDYFSYYKEYTNEYGEKTCVLMQIGMFYEMQMIKNDSECIGNLTDICTLLNIQLTKKNKNIEKVDVSNPYMAGFPKHALSKFLPILLEDGYTVVVIEQDQGVSKGKVQRRVTGVYSPSIQPLDIISKGEDNSLSSIVFEIGVDNVSYSICNINITTNTFHVYEKGYLIKETSYESVLDEIFRVLMRYDTKETIINVVGERVLQLEKEFLCDYLDLRNVHWYQLTDVKSLCSLDYQNTFLRRVYNNTNFGLLEPIEYFDLERYQLSVLNCIIALTFISKHDNKYLHDISIPCMVNDYEYLVLEMNTLNQLNVVGKGVSKTKTKYQSLFDIVDKTQTSIGRRGLKALLCKPLKDGSQILDRYSISEQLEGLNQINEVKVVLSHISDFVKLHRKMSLQALQPYEFVNLHTSYQKIIELSTLTSKMTFAGQLTNADLTQLQTYIEDYSMLFDLDEMQKYTLSENIASIGNYFKKGNIEDIDTVYQRIQDIEGEVDSIRTSYEAKVALNEGWIKTAYTEQDGYYLTCTKLRMDLLKKSLDKAEESSIQVKTNTSICKFTTAPLRKLSLDLVNNKELLVKKIKHHYTSSLVKFYDQYSSLFSKIQTFVELIDIAQSNIRCKNAYNYCKPNIVQGDSSYIIAHGIRHPIIERINDGTSYVPNDIELTTNKKGMILYALNSCGKSSLLRSVGLSVILAQCGLYVPCSHMELSPFHSIVTQVDLYDNLWKAQSSFITEMVGLKKILKVSTNRSLVLVDELTKGTEVISATSIFAASVLHLLMKDCKFIFTTHLQDVAKLPEIQKQKALSICHLSVTVQNDIIYFERKLQEGPCSELYGLEVAKAIGIEKDVIEASFEIRNALINRKADIVRNKRSRYNKKKILDSCEICGYYPNKSTDLPLDTHHIKFQCSADENNFTEHFHKNSVHNLVCLCKQCHTDVHGGKIIINGYIATTTGRVLDFTKETT
jgi:DNA mismatch repair protein MutS